MIIKLEELVMILDKTVQSTSDSPVSTADYGLKRSKKGKNAGDGSVAFRCGDE